MRAVALVLASAALHALAFPPWEIVPLAFCAVAPRLPRLAPDWRSPASVARWGMLRLI